MDIYTENTRAIALMSRVKMEGIAKWRGHKSKGGGGGGITV